MYSVHMLVSKAMGMRKTAMKFSYYHLFKEMVYNAGETDTQARMETYDDPPITSRCRFLYCSRWELNSNSMAHEGIN